MDYVSKFIGLNCAGDVLNAVHPMRRGPQQISEAMAIVKQIRPTILRAQGPVTVVELCAGSGLASVLVAHLFPSVRVVMVDRWAPDASPAVLGLTFRGGDIRKVGELAWLPEIDGGVIVISSHAYRDLAAHVVNIYNQLPNAVALAMVVHGTGKSTIRRGRRLGYADWAAELAMRAGGDVTFDDRILGRENAVVGAGKRVSGFGCPPANEQAGQVSGVEVNNG